MPNENRPPPTRAECIKAAGVALAQMQHDVAQMTPREQAEAAWTPTVGLTVDELEDLIRSDRGLTPIHSTTQGDPTSS